MPAPAAEIRPLRPDDVAAADAVAFGALSTLYPEMADGVPDAVRSARGQARVAHLLETDPGGAWVATVDGEVVGTALALVREGLWGFSLFGLRTDLQGRGIGTPLLRAALGYAEGCRGAVIMSSSHPAAMRSYSRAGFALHPAVALSGAWDPRRVPPGLRARPGDLEADRTTVDLASRHVRGASHAPDLPLPVAREGYALLVVEGEGFAVATEGGSPELLCATNDAAARDLLWSCLAHGPRGGSVDVGPVTAQNQWAIEVGLQAGLALSPWGPMFLRGDTGPYAPCLPSGAYL